MFYLIEGVIVLFFYAFYLALVAIVWAIGILITGIGVLVVALIEYFTQDGATKKAVKAKKEPFSFKNPFKKSLTEVNMGTYTYTFKGNDIVSTRKNF